MATFNVVILPAKKMANNKHKVRIMVSHNSQTRYIATDILLDSPSELKNGKVVKRSDKDLLNLRIKKIYDTYFDRYLKLEYANTLTCPQLIKMISSPLNGEQHRYFEDVVSEFLSQIDEDSREKTHKLYRLAADRFSNFTGPKVMMEHITPVRINQYILHLTKSKLSPTTIKIYLTSLKVIINYAVKLRYVTYDIDPFVTAKIPNAKKRDTAITVEQLKAIRDYDPHTHNMMVVRDIFMLTYYLAGMNLVDMLDYDFRDTDEMNYIRKKTKNTKEGENATCFTIPEEAWPIINKYMDKKSGKLIFGRYKTYESCYNVLARKVKELAKVANVKHYFTLYSARKSFVQHGFDIGIPLSTLEYCIGQSMKESRPIFNYVTIMKRHADKAIREILDNLK